MNGILTNEDLVQIRERGQTVEEVLRQMDNFIKGFPCLVVDRAAVRGDGILVTDDETNRLYVNKYLSAASTGKIVKFVPASGAATRMFKDLFAFANGGGKTLPAETLLENLDRLPFFDNVKDMVCGVSGLEAARAVLDYGANLPKALIPFHKYEDEVRTSMEEHLTEGALYASNCGQVYIHFTVSPEHRDEFLSTLEKVVAKYEKRHGVKFDISLSCQSPSTDIIAVTPDNEPFRGEDGSLLFRPGGHGALINNLNGIDADIIFIKNIDNVTVDRLKEDTIIYKKILAGLLIVLQERIFENLGLLDSPCSGEELDRIGDFVSRELCYALPPDYVSMSVEEKAAYLRRVLDRPLRVCAMVKNEGEPGGGPFWVVNRDGSKSLQIGEPSQIAPGRKHLLKEGTHFNPVDIVCAVKNRRGGKYDLSKYVDPETGFIADKTQDGKPLRAQELPGLWNGAMADWNTVFVEAPVTTFTPVKEVNDLLRPQHCQKDHKETEKI